MDTRSFTVMAIYLRGMFTNNPAGVYYFSLTRYF